MERRGKPMRLCPICNGKMCVGDTRRMLGKKWGFVCLGETPFIIPYAVESWSWGCGLGYRSENGVSVAFYRDGEGFGDYL